jgi:branched-subunit amino acid ABC-type transport system permease component
MPDPSFVFAQSLSGLTAAMFLFLIASGLSLIFGVLRVLNFAHGTFYMLGAYSAFQLVQWIGTGPGSFWVAALGAAVAVAVLGGVVERFPLINFVRALREHSSSVIGLVFVKLYSQGFGLGIGYTKARFHLLGAILSDRHLQIMI